MECSKCHKIKGFNDFTYKNPKDKINSKIYIFDSSHLKIKKINKIKKPKPRTVDT